MAAYALSNLAVIDANQVKIAKAGGLSPLIALVRDGNDEQKENAMRALMNLSANCFFQAKLATLGSIPPIVALLRDGNGVQEEKAARTLLNLSIVDGNKSEIAKAGGIVPLVELIQDGNDVQKEKAVGVLLNLALLGMNCGTIAELGGIPPLIALARDGNEVQKERAAGALLALLHCSANQKIIAEAGGIAPLIALVQDGNARQKSNAVWALSRLSVNCSLQSTIATAGGIPPIVALVQNGKGLEKEKAAYALSNLSCEDVNKSKIADAGGITQLVALIRTGNNRLKEYAVRALWNLAFENRRNQKFILSETGAVDRLFNLVVDGTPVQREYASGVLGFMARHLDFEIKSLCATKGGVEALIQFIVKPGNHKRIHEGLTALLGLCTYGDDIVRSRVKSAGGHEVLSKLVHSENEQNKLIAGQILTWMSGNLSAVSSLCLAMSEAEPLCRHVLERLHSVLDRGVYTVGVVKTRLEALLVSSGGKPQLFRLVGARSLADRLADLHHEIDRFSHQSIDGVWWSRWEAERQTMRQQLFGSEISSLLKDLDDVNAQTEALALITHEIRHNKKYYSKDERKFLHAVVTQVVGFSGLEVPLEEKWFIARHEVHVDDESFNRGSFGKIYHGTYMKAPVVIKCVEISSESNRNDFLREVNVWHDASRHPNIVQLYGACHVGTPCFMVCKYIAGGCLPEYLRRQVKIDRSCAWQALLDVTHGLHLLHSRGIIHSDLKGNNILVEGTTAMLTDFGMSVFGSESRPQFEHLGAIRWRAPEFITSGKTSFEADVYSLGMCIVEAVTGMLPWGLIPDISVKWHLKNGKFLQQPKNMTGEQWSLVCAMCDFDPAKRMKLDDVEKRIKMFADAEEEAMWKINTRAA